MKNLVKKVTQMMLQIFTKYKITMGLKRVSFKVAKAIKEAGYPQDRHKVGYVTEKCTDRFNVYHEGHLTDNASRMVKKIAAPYAVEVWLWLVRDKGINLTAARVTENWKEICWCSHCANPHLFIEKSDPEDVIIAAIEYLVDNNLIK